MSSHSHLNMLTNKLFMLLNSVALGTLDCELMAREQEEYRKKSQLFSKYVSGRVCDTGHLQFRLLFLTSSVTFQSILYNSHHGCFVFQVLSSRYSKINYISKGGMFYLLARPWWKLQFRTSYFSNIFCWFISLGWRSWKYLPVGWQKLRILHLATDLFEIEWWCYRRSKYS